MPAWAAAIAGCFGTEASTELGSHVALSSWERVTHSGTGVSPIGWCIQSQTNIWKFSKMVPLGRVQIESSPITERSRQVPKHVLIWNLHSRSPGLPPSNQAVLYKVLACMVVSKCLKDGKPIQSLPCPFLLKRDLSALCGLGRGTGCCCEREKNHRLAIGIILGQNARRLALLGLTAVPSPGVEAENEKTPFWQQNQCQKPVDDGEIAG